MARTSTMAGRLARLGFGDPASAAETLATWPEDPEALASALAQTADPDLALDSLTRLAAVTDLLGWLAAYPESATRLFAVVGASASLGAHLAVHPEDLAVFTADLTRRTRDELIAELTTETSDELRLAYRRAVLRIAARDLSAPNPVVEVESVSGELADLADAVVENAGRLAAVEVQKTEQVRLAIIALGKCGAGELNYVSDVDVLFVAEPADPETSPTVAIQIATKWAAAITRICSAHTAAGTIWPLDAALRPEGKAGPLVRTLDAMRGYYEKWAKNWEFQAMLKARPMAGDLALGADFVAMVRPLVWRERPNLVPEAQAMRRRVVSLIAAKYQDREIKLGSGGLRDVEFTVQLLQLVHGRVDERLRDRGTFAGLAALVEHGYVGRQDGDTLANEYRFQRLLEHRAQLVQLRRTHLIPADEIGLRRLAKGVGLSSSVELLTAWRRSTRRVLELHERMFYSPLLETVSRLAPEAGRLTEASAQSWMQALGFADPVAARTHIRALSQGVSRAAEIQKQLLPAMLRWFATGPNPDLGLLSFRQVSEAMGSTSWYLRTLRDGGAMAQNFATVLASSRYVVDLLLRAPQAVSMLADDGGLAPRSAGEILDEMTSMSRRHESAEKAIAVVRAVRRYELLRLAMADLLGRVSLSELGLALSDVTSATLSAALAIASREFDDVPPVTMIAVGRWGGGEMSYASDADAIAIIGDTDDPADLKTATLVLARLRGLLASPGPDPALIVDLDLRPEGKGGPLVRTNASALAYYQRWSSTWEAQALLRANIGAGDVELAAQFLAGIDWLRYPDGGLSGKQVSEIRQLKARMEAERLPRGTDPKRHLKLGPGGLSDVEWTIQLLQLRHGHRVPQLRTTQTLAALAAAVSAGLLVESDATALREAWLMATRLRNAVLLFRGRPLDVVPNDVIEVAAVGVLLGYEPGEGSRLLDDYGRTMRRARQVMDQFFWA